MPEHHSTQRRIRRQYPFEPIPVALRAALSGERDPVGQFTLIAEYLRPQLVRRAAACGVGSSAEDVAAEVITHWYNRVALAAPVTYATPDAYQHLRADLLASARNAAISWHRDDNNRTITVAGAALTSLAGAVPDAGVEAVFDTDDALALSEALSRLEAGEAEVARLVGLEALSIREVSDRLGIPTSTVADVWGRVQETLRGSVERYLTGDYCREAAPHLAVLDVQRHAERRGLPYRPLDDALGETEARRIARHVYGDPTTSTAGCGACRRARARQRTALGVFLPAPLLPSGVFEQVRDVLVGAWDATFRTLARLIDDSWAGLGGAGGAAPGLGGAKVAALVAAATVAVTAPTVVPDLTDHQRAARAAVAHVAAPKPQAATATPRLVRPTTSARATTAKANTTAQATLGSTVTRAVLRSAARQTASAPRAGRSGSALAEFTPGP